MDRKKQRRKRRAFTAEFKAEAVRLCKVGDRTIAQVAVDLDLTETALRDWVKRADIDAGNGPPEALTTAEREEMAKLRREVKRLTMERDILKAAAADSRGRRNGVTLYRSMEGELNADGEARSDDGAKIGALATVEGWAVSQ
jgi:transposase